MSYLRTESVLSELNDNLEQGKDFLQRADKLVFHGLSDHQITELQERIQELINSKINHSDEYIKGELKYPGCLLLFKAYHKLSRLLFKREKFVEFIKTPQSNSPMIYNNVVKDVLMTSEEFIKLAKHASIQSD